MPFGILVDDLLVADGRMAFRIPVHHPHSPVYQALLVEMDKGVYHGFGKVGIHGEPGTVPVAGSAELAELKEDLVSVFFLPCPGVPEEFLAGNVLF